MASKTSAREIRTRLSIEGEDEYKAALQETREQARLLDSEMEKLSAQFAGNTDSEEYLAQRTEILSRQQENAARQVRVYREYTDDARQAQEKLSQAVEEARVRLAGQQGGGQSA